MMNAKPKSSEKSTLTLFVDVMGGGTLKPKGINMIRN